MESKQVWKFATKQFTVRLTIEPDYDYRYDGDDEDGEIQAKLDSGEYVAFDSCVTVEWNGMEIAQDHLGGSVYGADTIAEFWTSHRDQNPLHRNCSIMRAARGDISICHYFPSMVSQAIREARTRLANVPHLRTIPA